MRGGVPNSLGVHLSASSAFFYMSHISAGGSGALLNEVCKSVPKTHESNWGENGKMGFHR